MELDGKTYPIKAIRNLNGHSIGGWGLSQWEGPVVVGGACLSGWGLL